MIILRQHNFSEKKLRTSDKLNLWLTKHATPKSMKKMMKDIGDDDDEVREKAIKKNRRLGATLGAINGGILGYTHGKTPASAIAGAAGGGLLFYGADKLAEEGKLGKNIKETRDRNKKINRDAALVADGEMTKEEFIKKWGKEKK